MAQYRGRVSGPLLDRIDLHIDVPALTDDDLDSAAPGEASTPVRERVARARERQVCRQGVPNAMLRGIELEERAGIDAHGRRFMREATSSLGLSARGRHRVLRVARTIADLAVADAVHRDHLAEAVRYRGRPLADP